MAARPRQIHSLRSESGGTPAADSVCTLEGDAASHDLEGLAGFRRGYRVHADADLNAGVLSSDARATDGVDRSFRAAGRRDALTVCGRG